MKQKKQNKNKMIIASLITVLITAVVVVLILRSKEEVYDKEIAKIQDITTYYSFNGNVEAKERQLIISDTIMQIKTIYAKEGDSVKKDDVILETTQGQKIKAKIDGEVGEILVEEGEMLVAGTKITTITDYSDLKVTIRVDEYDMGAIEVGKEVDVLINPLDRKIKGKITKVSKEATTVNGVSFFTASIDLEKDDEVLIGMSTEVTMVNENVPNAITISMKGLQFDNENKPFVYYRDNKDAMAAKLVTVGINDGNIVEIRAGVESGEIILIPRLMNTMVNPFNMMRNN